MKPLDVLVLSVWWPFPPDNGSRLRAYHLIRELARQGHRLRLVAGVQPDMQETVAGGIPPELCDLCAEIIPVPWLWYEEGRSGALGAVRALLSDTPRSILETPNPALTGAIAEQLKSPTDVVLAMEIGMDPYLPPVMPPVPVVLDQVELSGIQRAYQEARHPKARLRTGLTYFKSVRYWQKKLQRYQVLTTVSEPEADAVRRVVGGGPDGNTPRVVVVPNGVDIAAFPVEPSARRNPGQLLYNGALTYAPNREAVHWFAQAILPKIRNTVPDARLLVTGRYSPELAEALSPYPGVHLTGFLTEIKPVLAESCVAVVPLRAGGGTRLKILEAFAAHLPVVSTTIGAAGIGAESGKHLLLADTEEDFAEATVQALTDKTLARRMATGARRLAEERFDWRAIGAALSDVLRAAMTEETKR